MGGGYRVEGRGGVARGGGAGARRPRSRSFTPA